MIDNSEVTGKAGAPPHAYCVSLDSAVSAVVEILGTVASSKRRNTARRIFDQLRESNFLESAMDRETDIAWFWLPNK